MKTSDLVRDLARKYPKGPEGKLKKSSYICRDAWCDVYERTMPVYGTPQSDGKLNLWGGYDAETIWKTFSKNHDLNSVISYVSSAFEDEYLTRRKRRLRARRAQQKIEFAISDIKTSGRPGVWSVNWNYNDRVYLWAENFDDAQARSFVFSGLFGIDAFEKNPKISFLDFGGPEKAAELTRVALEGDMRSLENQIKYTSEKLENLKNAQREKREVVSVVLDVFSEQTGF